MTGGLLVRRSVAAMVVEATEGTFATLAASDANILVYDPVYTVEVDQFQRTPARSTMSRLDHVIGVQRASMSFRTELRGSGSVATRPDFDVPLRACGMQVSTVATVPFSSITGGPMEPMELVSGGSGGTLFRARVVGQNAATPLRIYQLSSTNPLNDMILTGATSAATCTLSTSTITASQGWEYRPLSTGVPSISFADYLDGHRQVGTGGRGTFTLDFGRVGEPGFFNFTIQGGHHLDGDVALPSPTLQSAVPKAMLGAGLTVMGFSPKFTTFSLDIGNDVQMREDANDSDGIVSAIIRDRNPALRIDPEMTLEADEAWFANMRAGTAGRVYMTLGTAAGNIIEVAAPNALHRSLTAQDRNGIASLDDELGLYGAGLTTGDDELQIVVR